MPLSNLQRAILLLLAAHRNPESYVAGATPLNQHGPRFSTAIDIFHDREESVAATASADAANLLTHGFGVQWIRREPGLHAAMISRDDEGTRLEWARDSDFRFFPAMPDEIFGYRLHPADLATNKALAAAGRREPRDVLDLLFVHDTILPLGAVVWAAVAKDPGFSPESLIAEIRRNARYRQDDYDDLNLVAAVDSAAVSQRLRSALDDASAFVTTMPSGKEGLLFIENGALVQPASDALGNYIEHPGRRAGHWPLSSEIGSAMMR